MGDGSGYIKYLEGNFEIFGRLGDVVYRRKRNGERYIYEYEYKPKYDSTLLSKRSEAVARAASGVSNPREADYQEIINRIYYYTPYILYAGSYTFSCNTFYKISRKGDYEIRLGLMAYNRRLYPRTKESYTFYVEGSYQLQCYQGGELYSEREVIVIGAGHDIKEAYAAWFAENLAAIIAMPVPDFEGVKQYKPHLKSRGIVQSMSGKLGDAGELMRGRRKDEMHFRQSAAHIENIQTRDFCAEYPQVATCWHQISDDFAAAWRRYHGLWLDKNIRKTVKGTSILHLWAKLIFGAAGELGFDLRELSVENWLPGVETLRDLLLISKEKNYGISEVDLDARIFP
jgi:hypothetical protein